MERLVASNIVDGGGTIFCTCIFHNGFEHLPALLTPVSVAGDTIHDEDGFYGFRTVNCQGVPKSWRSTNCLDQHTAIYI